MDYLWQITLGRFWHAQKDDALSERNELLKFGPQRSIVRLIGSALPLQSAQRITIPRKVRESFGGHLRGRSRVLAETECVTMHLINQPDIVTDVKHSATDFMSPTRLRQAKKIEELELCIHSLREDINKIKLDNEENKLNTTTCANTSICVHQSQPTTLIESPLVTKMCEVVDNKPPPPPPPMPVLTLPDSQLNIVKICKKEKQKDSKAQCRLSMGEVLKDLNKIKLRHVERSPGGRPIKLHGTPSSPENNLTTVLRKRYEAIHVKYEDKENNGGTDSEGNSFTSVDDD